MESAIYRRAAGAGRGGGSAEHQNRAIARTLQLREERPRWAVEMIALGRDFRPEQKAAFEKRQRQRGVHRVLYVEGADEA